MTFRGPQSPLQIEDLIPYKYGVQIISTTIMVNTSLDGGIEVGMPTMLAGSAGHFDEIEAFFQDLEKMDWS